MIKIQARVKGLEDWEGMMLRALDPAAQTRILTEALTQGANIVKGQAVQNAPSRSGALRAAIRVVARRTKPGHAKVSVMVGDAGFFKGDNYYAGFQEWGWKPTGPKKRRVRVALYDKDHTGRKHAYLVEGSRFIPKHAHYLARALADTGEAVENAAETIITDRVRAIVGELK